MIRPRLAAAVVCSAGLLAIGGAWGLRSVARAATTGPATLKPVSAFATIGDRQARSAALFVEAGKVIQSPRCLNCHPADRRPTQGENLHPHTPPMVEGAYPCQTCHGPENVETLGQDLQSVPGDPHWGLAPLEMAWQGRSLSQICAQVKDPARNGGRTLAQIHEHMARDHLVGWAWRPGPGRTPAPGTQEQFGALIEAWIETGAACPR